jgi:hypothetical protein
VPTGPDSRDYALAVLVALLLFGVYAAGAAPTIYVGDSGELVAAVATLGIPHPSGYPLYVLLGKLWTLAVPVGSIAYRMSLFSAATGAGRVRGALPHGACDRRVPAGGGHSAPGCSDSRRASGARRTCNASIRSTRCSSFSRSPARRGGNGRIRRAISPSPFFVCGLGATNHTFMAIAGIAFACAVALDTAAGIFTTDDRGALRDPMTVVRQAAVAALAFSAGLLPYLYLLVRSRMDPRLDWGNPGNVLGAGRRRAAARFLGARLHRVGYRSRSDRPPTT